MESDVVTYTNNVRIPHIKRLLKPYAELFRLEVDYICTGPYSEVLVIDGTEIMCGGNSDEAIMQEFIAYVFMRSWRHRSLGAFSTQTKNVITRYWKNRIRLNQLYFKGFFRSDFNEEEEGF